jgi:hypothetical protein
MLTKIFFSLRKTQRFPSLMKSFSTKTEGLKTILKQEIEYEEKNYSPVDKAELTQFYKTSGFNFTEKENTPRMELSKSVGNYDVIVNFLAKPPIPQEEGQQENANENERGKRRNNIRTREYDRVYC